MRNSEKYAHSIKNPYIYMPMIFGLIVLIAVFVFVESFISFGGTHTDKNYLNRNGKSCWDNNKDGKCSSSEDVNGDGKCDISDCLQSQLARTNYLMLNSLNKENGSDSIVLTGNSMLYTTNGNINNPTGDLTLQPNQSNNTIEFLSPVKVDMINTTNNDTADFAHNLVDSVTGIKFGSSSSSLFTTHSTIGNTTIITYGPWLTGQNATTYYLSHIRGNKAIVMLNGFQYECDPAKTNSTIVSYSPLPYLPITTATKSVSVKSIKTVNGTITNYFTKSRLSINTKGYLSVSTLDNSAFPCPSGTSATSIAISTYSISYIAPH